MEPEKKKNPYEATARKGIHQRQTRLSSPKASASPKQRTQSPSIGTKTSPLLKKRGRKEFSDENDGSDFDSDVNDTDYNNHSHASSKHHDEHIKSFLSRSGERGFDSDESIHHANQFYSADRSYSYYESPAGIERPHRILESAFPGNEFIQHKPTATDANNTIWLVGAAVVIIVVAVLNMYGPFSPATPEKRISCPQFIELKNHMPYQNELLWKTLKKGIENVINESPAEPSVFLLASSDTATTQNVMSKILNATANCMKTTNPIQLNGETFATTEMMADYGEIIAKYREPLKQEKIMYVSDVDKMPPKAAEAFHTICDTVTPLVSKAVIFFTVYMESSDYEQNNAHLLQSIERNLKRNWQTGDVNSENTVEALIGRVTDQVLWLRAEKHANV